jgi:hypothetical protein
MPKTVMKRSSFDHPRLGQVMNADRLKSITAKPVSLARRPKLRWLADEAVLIWAGSEKRQHPPPPF